MIVYTSAYGSTRAYAEELGRRLGWPVAEIGTESAGGEAPGGSLAGGEASAAGTPVIALSPIHGPRIEAAAYLTSHDFGDRPRAAVAVGITLVDALRSRDPLTKLLPDDVARFYLPGRLDWPGLSAAHRAVLTGVVQATRLKPRKSDADRALIDTAGTHVDYVDFAALDPIVDWARRNA